MTILGEFFNEQNARADEAAARAKALEEALRAAVDQAHHADGCAVRRRRDCTCWREPARRLLGV